MTELLIALSLVVTLFVVFKTGGLSPASVYVSFSQVSMVLFYWVGHNSFGKNVPNNVPPGLAFVPSNYSTVFSTVIEIYAATILLTGIAVLGLSKRKATDKNEVFDQAQIILNRVMSSGLLTLFAMILLILTIGEIVIKVAFPQIAYYSSGTSLGSNKNILEQACGPLCVVTSCLIVICWRLRKTLALVLLLGVFFYNYLLMLAFYSRWVGLTWAVVALLIASMRIASNKKALSLSVVACLGLFLYMYAYAEQGRVDRSSDVDITRISYHLTNVQLNDKLASRFTMNTFMGPFVTGEALLQSPLPYSPKYKLLSFSPFPSAIDHWKRVNDLQYRINSATPFNVFGELYNFGLGYTLLFAAFYAVCIRLLTWVYLRYGAMFGFLLTSPGLYPILAIHQYPIRNSFRLLLFSTLGACLISAVVYRRAKVTLSQIQTRKRRRALHQNANPLAPQGQPVTS